MRADPIGLEGGINLYVYAQENPVNYVDPKGESAKACKRRFAFGIIANYFPPKHCYVEFSDGTTLSYDDKGVHPDPAPNTWTKQCYSIKDAKKGCKNCTDKCLKKAMKACAKKKYRFFKHNCCDCVRSALNACKCDVPYGIAYVNLGF